MTTLTPTLYFYVIKVAGENFGDKDFFVATNREYLTQTDAEKVASELALKTPGNRYYVVAAVRGFMATAPALFTHEYAEFQG